MGKRRRPSERAVAITRQPESAPPPSPWAGRLGTLALAGLYALAFTKYIQLNAADLGRHLRNGEIILSRLVVPTTNEYSYTAPDFPFLNHHWASGVIFHLVHRVAGFPGLSLFAVGVAVVTFWLFFAIARRESRPEIAAAAAIVMLPVIGSRTEIRPEMFSYLFSGVFLAILWRWTRGAASWRMLVLLPVVEVLWVNTHVYFFVGPVLVAAFLAEELVVRGRLKPLLIAGAATVLATCVNPAGVRGALYPLSIMGNYGFDVVENQPPLLLARQIDFPPTRYFLIAFSALAASWLYALLSRRRGRRGWSVALLLLSLFVSALAWIAVRNFTLFGWIALVAVSVNLGQAPVPGWLARRRALLVPALLGCLALALVLVHVPYWRGQAAYTGIGVRPGNLAALDFYRAEGLRGPIFNNFNVGSYLIYGLYPAERVFVDNRPEAYPAAFFQEQLVPMLRDEARWREADERYRFNVIFFAHQDAALGPEFLARRVRDPQWAPVFADDDLIILVRRNDQNRDVIRQYELQVE